MKSGWKSKSLGELGSAARESAQILDDREYELWSVPSFADDEPEVAIGKEIGSAKLRVRPNDVLICKINPRINRIWLVRKPMNGRDQIASTEWLVFRAKPDAGLLPTWLVHFVSAPKFREWIESEVSGATGSHTRAKTDGILRQTMPLPPLPEQRRIVGILDEAFAGIATAKANAEKNLQNSRALFESHLQAVFTQRGEGWVETTIGQHIRFIDYRGKTPVKTQRGLRLITAKNVKMGYVQETPMEFIAPESYDAWMTRGIPKMGDVLFTTEAPLANVAQLDTAEKVAFAQRVIIMQPDISKLDSTFLKYLLLSSPVQKRIRAEGTGATVQGIKASLLKLIKISFPAELSVQRRLVATLDTITEETQRLESLYQRKLAALDELKKSLLHRAFSGQLTTDD